jgi:hypothetical protein
VELLTHGRATTLQKPAIPASADDVMRMVYALERAELRWCAIGGIAVHHWLPSRC